MPPVGRVCRVTRSPDTPLRYAPYVGYVNAFKLARSASRSVPERAKPWHPIRHLKTDSSGRVKWTHNAVRRYDYRMVVWSSHGSFLAGEQRRAPLSHARWPRATSLRLNVMYSAAP